MVFAISLIALLYAAYTDLTKRIIPNWLVLTALLVGFGYHLYRGSIIYAIAGVMLTVVLLIILKLLLFMSLGEGDIKFSLALGALLGPAAILVVLGSLVLAVIVGLLRRQKEISIPLAPYMLIAFLSIGGVFVAQFYG
ncbi:MAG TPA: hypothetical protein DDZ91_09950 [Firmicutes bacterium]|nr:hypothetical protein [Bacillota bacterium]